MTSAGVTRTNFFSFIYNYEKLYSTFLPIAHQKNDEATRLVILDIAAQSYLLTFSEVCSRDEFDLVSNSGSH